MSFTWDKGRQLQSVTKNGVTTSYTYDENGLRLSKTTGGVTTKIYRTNGQMVGMNSSDGKDLMFLLDGSGNVYGLHYDHYSSETQTAAATYYFAYNAQGDVIGIYDASGTVVATYAYDEWGNCTVQVLAADGNGHSADSPDHIAQVNPFRYRGYYYDNETGFYYLNSRYYDPETCRFLNADGYVATGQGMLDKNMFAYCENNPINRVDANGMFWKEIGNWFKNTWNSIKSKASSIFGSGSSTTVTIKKEEEFDPLDTFLPVSIRSGVKVTQTISEHGNTSKPVSAYGIHNTTNPILSSSGGIKINISNVTLDISLGLEDMGIFISSTNSDTTNSFGLKVNLSEFRVGFESSTSIKWDNITDTTYTNASFNGWFLIMVYEFVMTGQPVTSPSPSTNS